MPGTVRLTIVHLLVLSVLLGVGIGLTRFAFGESSWGLALGIPCGLALVLALTGIVLRWLCVWPLVPKCPRCGVWAQGFHRATGPEGLLLVTEPCHHAFVLQGAWVAPPLRLPSSLQANFAQEVGWAVRDDGRVFRLRRDYAAILLDEDGQEIGQRRARWPYWLVRWTAH